ncbi:hypothetical protein JG688_00003131 [Phytophthora aleatoria]|uniref:Uncharacterized protein n=1 Tax=Phytophthora aleatoria TaxID=2496075 RepID=A0A8J5IZU3_9STRA|nr:hypothetical protein JG688_00003131 [Phytophthora aleatoria]
MPSVSPAYTRYLEEEQFHSNLSRQVEASVDYIDTTLASMETHQQQAIDSLQELVRSLWPDALIDIYGDFFLLPPDKIVPMQCSVVIPYVADPIKPGRSICNCFRMHEVIQSWLALYQNLAAGVPVATCIGGFMSR